MKNDDIIEHSDEIDFSEMLAAVRPFIFTALIFGIVFGILGGLYARTIENLYVSTGKFTINDNSSSQISGLGGSISGLIGRSGQSNEAALAKDKIMSRDFIIDLYETANIDDDPYFNGDNEKPGIIGTLRSALIGSASPRTPEKRNEHIFRKFRDAVSVDLINTGIINVRVQHVDPVSAAQIANNIIETYIQKIESKRLDDDRRQVDLMEDRLLNAETALDEAQEAARIYAVENSVRSKEELNASSLKLNRFRHELERLNAILDGIEFLKQKRENSSSNQVSVAEFSTKHPDALTPLERDLGWTVDGGSFSLPSLSTINNLQRSLVNERDQIMRTLRVIEKEATQNSEAAGRLSELERDIRVRQTLYTGLVSQFEARALGAELQGSERVEWIQYAAKPVYASSPKVAMIALMTAFIGTILVILNALLQSIRAGKIHTSRKIAQFFQKIPLADNVGRSIGIRRKSLSSLLRSANTLSNVELVDIALSLREKKVKVLVVLSVQRTQTAFNLAAILGICATDVNERIALIELATKKGVTTETPTHSHGALVKVEDASQITTFNWVESGSSGNDTMSFDDAIKKSRDSFGCIVIATPSLGRGTLQKRQALSMADHVIVLAHKGITTQREINWAKRILSQVSDEKFDLVLA